eukprot:1091736-Pyramimonas_sp.AAC.1
MTKSASSVSWAPPTAPWSCSTCSCMNWGDRADCRQCGSTRPVSSSTPPWRLTRRSGSAPPASADA